MLIPYTTAASDDESIDLDLRTHSYVSNFALLYMLSVISYMFVIDDDDELEFNDASTLLGH